ncbi:hypothetical protein GE21DRAFT_4485 [Neurospora crassa]|uniref:Uncharacterized protein n=1 Tax=Neurospora crassa (strain ATCC 24698 / 74-OR23-1A / CBS 708.71 / DSM 1257 / FGSC 987) TaxID=367110 RepID=Q7RX98_NEUCR|nr:hypothetical protein NCU00189 [Neurospora crassa OR74A]EAA27176.1 hypothetical protein NCU00189 [Neurospora crassa OR74A]KHE89401.1 hypothetical protein GE21DRAFT_4485 [Neurospora crassa]|eukprot:XP_956412.1 hypothetical protein NCU00189 [Neurospora crassa OR74A]
MWRVSLQVAQKAKHPSSNPMNKLWGSWYSQTRIPRAITITLAWYLAEHALTQNSCALFCWRTRLILLILGGPDRQFQPNIKLPTLRTHNFSTASAAVLLVPVGLAGHNGAHILHQRHKRRKNPGRLYVGGRTRRLWGASEAVVMLANLQA